MTRGRYRWALAVVAVSAFMITMDNTVVANALPSIQRDLGMDKTALDWVATGYILMFSCLMIAGGRITDIYGCRTAFVSGMAIFTAASAVCGLAGVDSVLILGRIVQGAGAALALPATQVMITVGRTDKQRSLGTIAWVGAAGGATALGPTIGGLIVQNWAWGWIFLINIVPGILVILLGLVVLTSKGENRSARVDLPGVLISATMLFALVYGLETGRHQGWGDPAVLGVFALAAIAFACFVVVERWAPDPMINMRFFRNRVFVGGLLSQMLWGIGFNGMIFYAATFLQRYLGFSPPKAGLVMLPSAIVVMITTPISFWIAAKLGPRMAIGGGMTLMAGGMILFSMIERDYGFADLMPGVLITGFGSAMCMPLVMYVLKAVPEDQAGVASGILNVIREMSGAFGIAILGLLIHDIPADHASTASLDSFRDGMASGLILGAALVLFGGMISGVTLPSKRGWMGPKHGRRRSSPPTAEPVLTPAPSVQPLPALEPAELVGAHATTPLLASRPYDPTPWPTDLPHETPTARASEGPYGAPTDVRPHAVPTAPHGDRPREVPAPAARLGDGPHGAPTDGRPPATPAPGRPVDAPTPIARSGDGARGDRPHGTPAPAAPGDRFREVPTPAARLGEGPLGASADELPHAMPAPGQPGERPYGAPADERPHAAPAALRGERLHEAPAGRPGERPYGAPADERARETPGAPRGDRPREVPATAGRLGDGPHGAPADDRPHAAPAPGRPYDASVDERPREAPAVPRGEQPREVPASGGRRGGPGRGASLNPAGQEPTRGERTESLRVSSRGPADDDPLASVPPTGGHLPWWWQVEPPRGARPRAPEPDDDRPWPPPPPEGYYAPYTPEDVPDRPDAR
ncbi:MFS transporter [Actinomadura rayongensis]|uniref:MFS transporter n=1 Tax=Actinomadura rayongensis TaxID=1429076 RepID=UPI0035ECA861